ncbi:hypothetical protein GCM10027195_33860 [Comamonas sediminis]
MIVPACAPGCSAPGIRAPGIRAPGIRAPDIRVPDIRAPASALQPARLFISATATRELGLRCRKSLM